MTTDAVEGDPAAVEVRHLQAFVAVAEELHFGRAARNLQLSPSPVSRTVMELEKELGTALFDRGHHAVQLTAAGEWLLPRGRELLAAWTSFTTEGRLLGRPGAADLRIGSPSLAPASVVERVVEQVVALQPGLAVRVEFASSIELVAGLRAGSLDLAVVHLPLDVADLRTLPLARYRMSLAMPVHDELAQLPVVQPEQLAGRRVLQLAASLQPATMKRTLEWLTSYGAVVEVLPDADLVRLAQLVRHGRGVALSTNSGVVGQVFTQPGLTIVPLAGDGPDVELGLLWRPHDVRAPLIDQLIHSLLDQAEHGSLEL